MTLPDCMMPDGAEPCKAFQELEAERDAAYNRGMERAAEIVTELAFQSNRPTQTEIAEIIRKEIT